MKCYTPALLALTVVAKSNDPLPVTEHVQTLQSCKALDCDAPAKEAVCSRNSDDSSQPPVSVALVEAGIQLPKANLSLTLVDGLKFNDVNNYQSQLYKYSDVQLYVGTDPKLADQDKPSGCLLMMQYQQQTFPEIQYSSDQNPHEGLEGTTSCEGVIDPICRSDIVKMIEGFNASSADGESRCDQLIEHVSQGLRSNQGFCGESGQLANLMNVTGGDISGDKKLPDNLGSGSCLPVVPSNYELRKVASQVEYYLDGVPSGDAKDFSEIYGGRAGFTPVIGVVYEEDEDKPEIQFQCLQTLQPNGETREARFPSSAANTAPVYTYAALAILSAAMVL